MNCRVGTQLTQEGGLEFRCGDVNRHLIVENGVAVGLSLSVER